MVLISARILENYVATDGIVDSRAEAYKATTTNGTVPFF